MVRRALQGQKYDAVIFGSIMRNIRLYAYLQPRLDSSRTILMHGEDLTVDHETLDKLASTGSHVFVRAIG